MARATTSVGTLADAPCVSCLRAVVTLVALVACAPAIDLSVQSPPVRRAEPGAGERARVQRAVDGDTVEVRLAGGAIEAVRLLGIDSPESVDPRRAVQCFGREAAAAAQALLAGRTVELVKDVEDRDGFGRLLRYVYLGDELMNARLVVNGYAFARPHPPNLRHAELLDALEAYARAHGLGLWSEATCAGRR